VAGTRIREELTAAGVRCAFTVDPSAATGCVVVLVDEQGQRTMLSDRGANALLRAGDLDPAVLDGATHLHLSGYVLLDDSSRPAGVAALATARAAGLSTSVDPQVASMIEPGFIDLLRDVDLLLPNEEEFAVLVEQGRLLDTVRAVAVTLGADGATWLDRTSVAEVAGELVECVDSTGAGDAFDAGLLVAWLKGAQPREALRAGVRAGALAVSRIGARPPG
jgi:sugar/nucleoside kinase (ribokinase family)